MSLYRVQKLLFQLNNDAAFRARHERGGDALLGEQDLTADERRALGERDVAALYRMGVHPLLLAPFAGRGGLTWAQYLATLEAAERAGGPPGPPEG